MKTKRQMREEGIKLQCLKMKMNKYSLFGFYNIEKSIL